MKKTLFSLEEIMPSNIYKNTKESNLIKNKERENNKLKSVVRLKKKNKSNQKNLYQTNKPVDYSKTPVKIVGKGKINKFMNNFNECNKNNNTNFLSVSTNGKQMLLLEYFLQNNNKNVKTNLFLIGAKKEEFKNLNKVTKSLFPLKKQINNSKFQNTRYFNNNSKNYNSKINRQKEKNNIKKNNNQIINKKEKIKEQINKKEEEVKNNNIIFNKTNISTNNNIVHKNSYNLKSKNKEEKDSNLYRTSVNLSNKKKESDKIFNENSNRKMKEIKTPNNIFKNKIVSILNNNNNNVEINEFNKSDNFIFVNQIPNRRASSKKGTKKSNSLEKFLSNKLNINNLSTKSLFSLTKVKKRNQSENSFLINNIRKSDANSNIKKIRKNIKENKSCDTFFQKKNSVCVENVNLKIIRNNKENMVQKSNNLQNKNGNTKKNYFNSAKIMKRFKKHKSLDFNKKSSLNGLMISQNEIKELLIKKDNKTPEKKPSVLNIQIENNNNKNTNANKKIILNYTYIIVPGNNRKLIEKCLLNRDNWIPSSEDKKEFANFIWTPLSSQINFAAHALVENAQFVNHFEYHNELTNKSKTFINLLRYCEFNDIDLFSFYPLTIIFTFNSNSLNNQIEKFKKLYNEVPSLIYEEKEKTDEDDDDSNDQGKLYSDYFSVNLSKKLGSLQKLHIPKTHYIGKNLWLLKRDNLNRGRKIKVFSNLESILKEINSLNEQKFPKNLLIQKYIEQPLLYNKRKFDIRIWVLFTYLDKYKKYEVYIFKEGHLKACCDEYDINSEDLFIHLTNYSVQKHNKNFSKSEIGNEISFADFQKELDKNGSDIDFKKNIFPEITQIVARSANSVKGKINLSKRTNCFEIFGYDFILDINYKPFLLEINTNPGYEESSPLIKMLVPRMIDDAMRLTIDRDFETRYKSSDPKQSNFYVDGYSLDENMWLKIKTIL